MVVADVERCQGQALWGPREVGLALAALVVMAVALLIPAAIAAALLAQGEELTKDVGAMAALLGANVAVEALILAVPLWWVMGRQGTLADLGWRWPRRGGLWTPLATLVGAYLVLGIYAGALEAAGLERLLPKSSFPKVAFQEPSLAALVGLMALGLAPLAEETFFRGFVFQGLRRRWGLWWSALASGALFGLMHLQVGAMIPFSAIGVVFALAYAYSGSILPSVAAHLAFNSVSFGIMLATV
ncbi:MAG: CPBP family intramembrane glutamic endopeptidase [Dehalococcoidia bacterium]|jgi:membrane protease YdiL (CAAX protease family)|nr:CPBP family intramembrane glutamic endopeptidase [Dehalococcoidia bacterium]